MTEADEAEAAELLKELVMLDARIAAQDEQERRRISAANLDAVMLVYAMIHEDEDAEQARIDACMERVRAYSDAGDVAAHGWMLAAIDERISTRQHGPWAAVQWVRARVGRYLSNTEATALH